MSTRTAEHQENPWQPEDYLQQLKERMRLCTDVMEFVEDRAQWESSKNWAPHLPQILDAIDFFRDLCREEIAHYGEWRHHGFQIDEVIAFIDGDLEELARWICRITNTLLRDPDEDVQGEASSNE
jgi:hypothetical protein